MALTGSGDFRLALFFVLMTLTELIILALATWRITNLFVDDSEGGPKDVLHFIRYRVGVRYDDKHRAFGTTMLARAMTCFWCWSFWMGLFVLLISLIPEWIGFYLLLPFALSGAALAIKKGVIDGR